MNPSIRSDSSHLLTDMCSSPGRVNAVFSIAPSQRDPSLSPPNKPVRKPSFGKDKKRTTANNDSESISSDSKNKMKIPAGIPSTLTTRSHRSLGSMSTGGSSSGPESTSTAATIPLVKKKTIRVKRVAKLDPGHDDLNLQDIKTLLKGLPLEKTSDRAVVKDDDHQEPLEFTSPTKVVAASPVTPKRIYIKRRPKQRDVTCSTSPTKKTTYAEYNSPSASTAVTAASTVLGLSPLWDHPRDHRPTMGRHNRKESLGAPWRCMDLSADDDRSLDSSTIATFMGHWEDDDFHQSFRSIPMSLHNSCLSMDSEINSMWSSFTKLNSSISTLSAHELNRTDTPMRV